MTNKSDIIFQWEFSSLFNPRVEQIEHKKLVGKNHMMSLSENKTAELWRSFMSERELVRNKIGNVLFSVQIYNKPLDLKTFTVDTVFEKWAAVEVSDFESIPGNMLTHVLTGGLYVIFAYKGSSSDFKNCFLYIFGTWFPGSDYEVDDREHFEILGSKYRNNDPESEEEIWIPVKKKGSKK